MKRNLLEQREYENRKKIEKILATSRQGMTISEIMKATGLSRPTVKSHLEKLMSIGRVEAVKYGDVSVVYFWNGEGKYQDKVKLSDRHILFLDVMINPWGKPFIRIKESKKIGERWEDIGAIIIDKKSVNKLIDKLKMMSKHLDEYQYS